MKADLNFLKIRGQLGVGVSRDRFFTYPVHEMARTVELAMPFWQNLIDSDQVTLLDSINSQLRINRETSDDY